MGDGKDHRGSDIGPSNYSPGRPAVITYLALSPVVLNPILLKTRTSTYHFRSLSFLLATLITDTLSLNPSSVLRFYMATNERNPLNLAYLISHGEILVSNLLAIENRRCLAGRSCKLAC